jgi:hypothetical protein
VSRYVLKSDLYEFEVTVDINIEIFPLQVGSPHDRAGGCRAALRFCAGGGCAPCAACCSPSCMLSWRDDQHGGGPHRQDPGQSKQV